MFRRRPDPFAALSLDSQYQEPEERGSFLNAVVRSEGGFLEAADNAEREANRSARAYRRQPAGEYISPFRGEEHHEVAQINKMKRYPTVSANSAFAHVHPRELGFRTFGHETKRAKDIPFPMYLRENEARQDELLRQVQVREARLAHVKNSQILYDYTAEGKRKRAKAKAREKEREEEKKKKKKSKGKGKSKTKNISKAEDKTDSRSNSSEKPGNQAHELTPEATPEPKTPAEDAGDDLETIEGDLGSAYTFETVPEGASYDYVIEYEAVAPGATHGPKTAKPVRPVRRADKATKEAKSPSKVKAKAKESVAKGGEPVVTKKESKRIEPESAAGKTGSRAKGSKKPVSSKEWKEVKSHIEPVVVEGGPHGAGKHVEPVLVTKETRHVEKSFEPKDENQEKKPEDEVTSVQPKDTEASGVTSLQPEDEATTVEGTETGEVTSIQPKDEEQGIEPEDEEASALKESRDADAKKVQHLLGKPATSSKRPTKNASEKVPEAAPDVKPLGTGLGAADTARSAEELHHDDNLEREAPTETAEEVSLDGGSDQVQDEVELATGAEEEEQGEEGASEVVDQEEEHDNDEEDEELDLDEHDMQSEVSSITSDPVDYRTVPRVLTFPEFEPKQSKFSFKKNAVTQRPTNPLASPNDPELMVKTDREGFLSKAVYDKVKYDNRRHDKWLVEFTQTEKEKCEQKQVEYDERLAYLRKKVDKLQARMQKIREAADRKLEITHNELTTKLFQETHEFIQMKNKIFLETKAIQEQKERETAEVKVKQDDVQKEIDALNSERDDVQREYISWSNRLAEMSAHLDAKISKLVTIRRQYRSTQGELDLLNEKKAAMEKEMEEHKKTHANNTKAIESYNNKEYLPRVHEIDDKISSLLNELSIIKQESANEKVKLGNITKELEKERIAHEEKLKLEAEERQRKEEDLLGKQREEAEARAAKIKKKHEKELRKMKKSYEKQLKELKEQQSKRDDDGAAGGAAGGDVGAAAGGNIGGGDASSTAKDEGVTTTVTKTVSKSSTKVVDNKNGDNHKTTATELDSSTNVKSPLANGETSRANEKVNHKYHSGRPSMDSSLFEYVTEEEILPA